MRALVALVTLALVLTGCGDDAAEDEEPDPTVTETVTQTRTETETVTETEVATPTGDEEPPTEDLAAEQTFIVGPQEPVTTAPSDPIDEGGEGVTEFTVVGRYDDGEMPPALNVTYLPCENVSFETAGVTFADADGNGVPDGVGESDEGAAFIYSLNGERYEPETRDGIATNVDAEDGQLAFELNAERPDCATPMVWADENGDGEPDLADGEPFGAAKVTWAE